MEKRPHLGTLSTKRETQKQLNKQLAEDPIGPNRAPKRLRVPYIKDLYPTSREDGSLVNNKSLAQLQNLKSSKTFKGENTNKISFKREGGIFISPLTANSSKTLKGNNKMDL